MSLRSKLNAGTESRKTALKHSVSSFGLTAKRSICRGYSGKPMRTDMRSQVSLWDRQASGVRPSVVCRPHFSKISAWPIKAKTIFIRPNGNLFLIGVCGGLVVEHLN